MSCSQLQNADKVSRNAAQRCLATHAFPEGSITQPCTSHYQAYLHLSTPACGHSLSVRTPPKTSDSEADPDIDLDTHQRQQICQRQGPHFGALAHLGWRQDLGK